MNNPVATALRRHPPGTQYHQGSMDLTETWPKGNGHAEAGEEGGEKRKRRPKRQEEKREATIQGAWDSFWNDWQKDWGSAEEWRQESWHATKLGLLAPLTTVRISAPHPRSTRCMLRVPPLHHMLRAFALGVPQLLAHS